MTIAVMPSIVRARRDAALKAIPRLFGIQPEAVLGQERRADVMLARHALYYVLAVSCEIPCTQVADTLRRNHTTVLHGVKRAEVLKAGSAAYAQALEELAKAARYG